MLLYTTDPILHDEHKHIFCKYTLIYIASWHPTNISSKACKVGISWIALTWVYKVGISWIALWLDPFTFGPCTYIMGTLRLNEKEYFDLCPTSSLNLLKLALTNKKYDYCERSESFNHFWHVILGTTQVNTDFSLIELLLQSYHLSVTNTQDASVT